MPHLPEIPGLPDRAWLSSSDAKRFWYQFWNRQSKLLSGIVAGAACHQWLRRYPNGRMLVGSGDTVHIECDTVALGTRVKATGLWTWAWSDLAFSDDDRTWASHIAAAARQLTDNPMFDTMPVLAIPDEAENLTLAGVCCVAAEALGVYRFDSPDGNSEIWVLLKAVRNVNYPAPTETS